MEYISLPVNNFLVCSEDEDTEDVDSTDFQKAASLLKEMRGKYPNQAWSLVAEIDA